MNFNKETINILEEIANNYNGNNAKGIKSIIYQILESPKENIDELETNDIDFNLTNEQVYPYPDKEIQPYKDYRIKNLYLKNFRTFPYETNSKPYGIKFTDNKQNICSLFLVGSNGTGKSTLFSALEYFYSGTVSYTKYRNETDENTINDFLTYGFGRVPNIKNDNVILGIEHNEISNLKEYKLGQSANISSSATFCSEYDFKTTCQDKSDLKSFILNQLGYLDIYKLSQRLNDIIKKNEEYSQSLKHLIDNQEEILIPEKLRLLTSTFLDICLQKVNIPDEDEIDRKIVEFGKKQKLPNDILFNVVWNQIIKNKSILNENTENIRRLGAEKEYNEKTNDIKILYKRLRELYKTKPRDKKKQIQWVIDIVDKLQNELQLSKESILVNDNEYFKQAQIDIDNSISCFYNLKKAIDNKISELLNDFKDHFNDFIINTLEIFSTKNESYNLIVTANSCKLKINVNERSIFETESHEYLNTFRFELFIITIKVALAIKYMQQNKHILPIVIDDVFNANDFENSNKIDLFVRNITEVYNKYIYSKSKIPIQLILFTHDEKVLHAFKNSFSKYKHKSDKNNTEYNYIIGRLFHFDKAQQIDKYYSEKIGCSHPFYNLYLTLN